MDDMSCLEYFLACIGRFLQISFQTTECLLAVVPGGVCILDFEKDVRRYR